MALTAAPASARGLGTPDRQLLVGLVVLVAAALALPVWAAVSGQVAVYWAIGLGIGFVLQRSRFCFAGAFRDLVLARDGRLMRAVIAGLLLATGGFALLEARFVPDPAIGGLPPMAHVLPIGPHLVVGGFLFGIGMVLAGGCVSGTLFRIGEGYLASWVALAGILVGLGVAAHTWNWWWDRFVSAAPLVWLPGSLGFGWAVALTVAALAALYLLVLWWETSGAGPALPQKKKAAPEPITFGDHLRAQGRVVFRRGWPALVGGLALAGLNLFAYSFDHPLGVTGELGAWSERIMATVGLGAGQLVGLDQFAGCNLALGAAGLVTDRLSLDLGLIVGSLIGALLAGEFKLRAPRVKARYVQTLGGGALMGYGAGIGLGCTIGAFFSAVPSLGLNGWVFAAALLAGGFVGVQAIKRLP